MVVEQLFGHVPSSSTYIWLFRVFYFAPTVVSRFVHRRCDYYNVVPSRSLFYLLSNNHVNDMIMFDFRLEDEEVLSHFASFLKTLSLRLNQDTVQVQLYVVCMMLFRKVAWLKHTLESTSFLSGRAYLVPF